MIDVFDTDLGEDESYTEGHIRYDEVVREGLPVAERFDGVAYKRYVRLAKISDVLDRDAILKNLNCAGEVGGKLCFTNAGALFFRVNGEDVVFRHAGVVCALYKGMDKTHILDVKELNGDMVSNIDDAMVFLKKHLRLSYKIETLRREDILELPEDALREAIVNAVCHRDYFEKGARVMVEVYDDRVEIVSPGGVCKGITPKNFGTVSIARNSVVASMLHRVKYIEQIGTGILRMKNAAREAEVAEPEFELFGFFRVTFRRVPASQLIAAGVVGAGDGDIRLLRAISDNPAATYDELAAMLSMARYTVYRKIKKLQENGKIEREGTKKSGRWIVK